MHLLLHGVGRRQLGRLSALNRHVNWIGVRCELKHVASHRFCSLLVTRLEILLQDEFLPGCPMLGPKRLGGKSKDMPCIGIPR